MYRMLLNHRSLLLALALARAGVICSGGFPLFLLGCGRVVGVEEQEASGAIEAEWPGLLSPGLRRRCLLLLCLLVCRAATADASVTLWGLDVGMSIVPGMWYAVTGDGSTARDKGTTAAAIRLCMCMSRV